jgi:hypothetical protein
VADFSSDLPVLGTPTISGLNPADHQFSGAAFRNSLSEMEIEQLDLSGYFDINDRQTLDFGVMLSETNNRTAYGENQYADWGGLGTPEDVPDDLFTTTTSRPWPPCASRSAGPLRERRIHSPTTSGRRKRPPPLTCNGCGISIWVT